MRYFLLGLPGCGKSHWGKKFADQLSISFIDLDYYIVKKEGKSITQIFSENGEAYFRATEKESLQEIIDKNTNILMSCGGGTPCFNNNMEFMNQHGKTIFLNPSLDIIAKRIWKPNQENKRPLFKDCNNLVDVNFVLQKLYEKRKSYYKKSQFELTNWDKNSIFNI